MYHQYYGEETPGQIMVMTSMMLTSEMQGKISFHHSGSTPLKETVLQLQLG